MYKTWRIFFVQAFLLNFSASVFAADFVVPTIKNNAVIARDLKVSEFENKKFRRRIKVAILDNGWTGYQSAIGKALPADTVYHSGKESAADEDKTDNFHGVVMAQILAGVIKESGAAANYELHLFNAVGYTKLNDAIETVINDKFDIVLYSQVWEFGGSGDGKGFINAAVTKATEAGIVWINAAGNFGRSTRKAPVDGKVEGQDEWVQFKDAKGKLESRAKIECKTTAPEQCTLKVLMAWNDFKDDTETGTDKDLDLYLVNASGEVKAQSEKVQRLAKDPTNNAVSLLPREVIETKLDAGTYYIKAKVKSKNFSASQDELRITIFGNGVVLDNPTVDETLLPPADNANVIVIGASDDLQTSSSKALKKPDILLKSLVNLDNGSSPFGSSNAAAMAAGVSVLRLGTGTEKTREAVLAALKPLSRKKIEAPAPDQVAQRAPVERRAPSERRESASGPAAPGEGRSEVAMNRADCIESLPANELFASARRFIQDGAALVNAGGRYAIVAEPRVMATLNLSNLDDDQVIYLFPEGIRFVGPEDRSRVQLDRGLEVRTARRPVCRTQRAALEPSWTK